MDSTTRDRSSSRERKKRKSKQRVRDVPRDGQVEGQSRDMNGPRIVVEQDDDHEDHMGHKTATLRHNVDDVDDTIRVTHEGDRRVTTIVYKDPTPPPSPPPEPPRPRSKLEPRKPVSVEVRVIILRVVDIDTVNQNFLAEVFLQGKWLEPKLARRTQQELNKVNLDDYWTPRLAITNIQGKYEDDVSWLSAHARGDGAEPPIVFYRRRVRARFSEILELKQFPVDRQELTVHVTTELTEDEVSLAEDRSRLSRVLTDNFGDEQEFHLFEHVVVNKRYIETDMISPHASNAKLLFKCHVLRKAGYFVWNVILIVFLITLLSLTCYVIDRDSPQFRLGVVVKLLLTAVAFKWTVSYNLPKISYPTYLDIYLLTCLLFLILQAVLFAVSALVEQELSSFTSLWTDRIMFIVSLLIFAFYNIFFVIYIVVKLNNSKNELTDEERKYNEKKEAISSMVRSYSQRGRKSGGETDSGYTDNPYTRPTPNGSLRQSRLL